MKILKINKWDDLKKDLESQVSQLSRKNAELLDLNNSLNASLNDSSDNLPNNEEMTKKDETINKFKQLTMKLKKETEKFKQLAAKESAEHKKTKEHLEKNVKKVSELSS